MGKDFQNNNLVTVTDRTILASQESENNCIGLMLKDREMVPMVGAIASQEDFNYEQNKRIVGVIYDLYERGEQIDSVTVKDELEKKGELDSVGGIVHLYNLEEAAINAKNVEEYAKRVRDWSAIRQVKNVCEQGVSEIRGGVLNDPVKIIDSLTKNLHTTGGRLSKGGFSSSNQMHDSTLNNIENAYASGGITLGVPSGIAQLDNMTGGFQRGDYIVIGARTSVGKTAFAVQMAAHCAVYEGMPAAIFSLEMSKEQLMYRMIAGESGVSAKDIRTGNMSAKELEKVKKALQTLKNSPIHIDDTTDTTVLEIKSKLKKLQHQVGPIGMVVVDYINLVRSSTNFDNSYSAMGEVSRDFKGLAKELSVPVLVLAQLNRNTEGRADKMPSMSDIAESDKIPRDADLVMLLYRNSYYQKKGNNSPQANGPRGVAQTNLQAQYADQDDNSAVLLLDKHRNGPTGTIDLEFDKKTTKFSSSNKSVWD